MNKLLDQSLDQGLLEELEKRKNLGRLRTLKPCPQQSFVDFASNDYLGFAREPALQEKSLLKSARLHSNDLFKINGSTGSRLLTGNNRFVEDLEEKFRKFFRGPAALIFNSGFDLNLGLFSCLLKSDDTLVFDEYIHASIRDGAKLSGCHRFPFRHNDCDHLQQKLKALRQNRPKEKKGRIFVVIEALYSMDGDFSPLAQIAQICEEQEAHLIVDEAHSGGVYGPSGRGLVAKYNLEDKVYARIFTFGKAFGVQGAVLIGSEILKEYVINFCHSFIYTTALPLQIIKTLEESLTFIQKADEKREKLLGHAQFFIDHLRTKDCWRRVPLILRERWKTDQRDMVSHIIPWFEPDERQLFILNHFLKEKGFEVFPILSPTVKRGTERLRIILHAFNTIQEIKDFIQILDEAYGKNFCHRH